MLTLIKREINDNAVFFLLSILLTILAISISVSGFFASRKMIGPFGIPEYLYLVFGLLLLLLPLFAVALGGVQSYLDKKKKICSFLTTLSVTRTQLLSAKIMSGLIWLIFPFALLVVVYTVLMNNSPSLIPVDYGLLSRMFLVTFLVSLACYFAGLLLGLLQNKFIAYFSGLIIYILLLSLIIIKGFGSDAIMIYTVVSIILLINIYQRFVSISL